jgi:hypothetical protein
VKTSQQYPAAEVERLMKLQDVLLKAMARKITWWAAAEIIGVSDRTMRPGRSTTRARPSSPSASMPLPLTCSVIEARGLFCALYRDRGSHFFVKSRGREKKATGYDFPDGKCWA